MVVLAPLLFEGGPTGVLNSSGPAFDGHLVWSSAEYYTSASKQKVWESTWGSLVFLLWAGLFWHPACTN